MIWWDHGIARLCDREALRVAPFGAQVRVSEMGRRMVRLKLSADGLARPHDAAMKIREAVAALFPPDSWTVEVAIVGLVDCEHEACRADPSIARDCLASRTPGPMAPCANATECDL